MLGAPAPTYPMLVRQGLNVACYASQLGSDCFANNSVVISGYSIVVIICNYKNSPITADTIPSTPIAFTTRVDPVSAPPSGTIGQVLDGKWWSRRVLPPGPQRLFRNRV